jgi:hypothetical protein
MTRPPARLAWTSGFALMIVAVAASLVPVTLARESFCRQTA